PPQDRVSRWFTDVGQQVYNTAWANDNNWQVPGRGAAAVQDNNQVENPNYQLWIGNDTPGTGYANGYFGGSMFFYEPGAVDPSLGLVLIPNQYLGIGTDGERDGNLSLADGNPLGIAGYRDWAQYTG